MILKLWKLRVWQSKRLTACGMALLSFAAGSLLTARWMHVKQVRADSNRVFELRVYHAVPGKLSALESRFGDTTSKLLAKHNLNVVGYWTSNDGGSWDNSFIFMVAHASQDDAKKNWDAMWGDPAFQEVVKSEQTNKLVDKIDFTFMRPTDYSPMK
jgi:hypothetical protein